MILVESKTEELSVDDEINLSFEQQYFDFFCICGTCNLVQMWFQQTLRQLTEQKIE